MTATLQVFSRKKGIAIDTLRFETKVSKHTVEEMKTSPETGVNIYGLFI